MDKENLRDFYITPLYLETMRYRSRYWTKEFIKTQLFYFKQTIPDYPEVHEILENELHTRDLNHLRKNTRRLSNADIEKLLKQSKHKKYEHNPDYREVIQTEIEIRSGAKRLKDFSGDLQARITEL